MNIIGASFAWLTLTNVQNSDAGEYSVVISNSAGSVTSNSATLTVRSVDSTSRLTSLSVRTAMGADAAERALGAFSFHPQPDARPLVSSERPAISMDSHTPQDELDTTTGEATALVRSAVRNLCPAHASTIPS